MLTIDTDNDFDDPHSPHKQYDNLTAEGSATCRVQVAPHQTAPPPCHPPDTSLAGIGITILPTVRHSWETQARKPNKNPVGGAPHQWNLGRIQIQTYQTYHHNNDEVPAAESSTDTCTEFPVSISWWLDLPHYQDTGGTTLDCPPSTRPHAKTDFEGLETGPRAPMNCMDSNLHTILLLPFRWTCRVGVNTLHAIQLTGRATYLSGQGMACSMDISYNRSTWDSLFLPFLTPYRVYPRQTRARD